MRKETSLCMGCMAEIKDAERNTDDNQKVCAVCGYVGNSVFLSSYLKPTTFLAERYIIGKLISYNGEGAYYIAFDTVGNVKVTVREYMPDTLCGRKKDAEAIEVNPQFVALYKTYMSEFVELNRTLMGIGQSLRTQRVLDVFSENNTAYAVYEYIAGISLKSYLSNLGGVLPWEQVKELFTPLFSTLGVIHSAGIIHRGISPSTILLNDKSELVLINFGITAVRTYGSEINYEVFAGYAAPEQYCGKERHGSCTDVYGLAAVLYKVLTGQMPTTAISRKEDDNITEPSLINRNIPQSVSAAIMKGLTLDVNARTQEVSRFIDGLFESAPVSVPDSTNEILIKKPPRIADDEEMRQKGYKNPALQRRRRSHVLPVTGLVLLLLLVITILTIMLNPELIKWTGGDIESTTPVTDNRLPPPIPGTPPVNPVSDNTGTNPATPSGTDITELYITPDFTTRRFDVVENNAAFAFLKFNPIYEFSYDYGEGLIFHQDIPHGTEVARGTEITLMVSNGPPLVPLPVYEGMSLVDYEEVLNNAKINHYNTGEHHDEIEEGYVIKCGIPGDRWVTEGDIIDVGEDETVVIYYSLGPEQTEEVDEYIQWLIDNGLVTVDDESQNNGESDENADPESGQNE